MLCPALRLCAKAAYCGSGHEALWSWPLAATPETKWTSEIRRNRRGAVEWGVWEVVVVGVVVEQVCPTKAKELDFSKTNDFKNPLLACVFNAMTTPPPPKKKQN